MSEQESLLAHLLKVKYRQCSDKKEHDDEMAEAAAHDKQVENFMTAEIWMGRIEKRKLQSVNDAADRIDDAAGQQPGKLCDRQCVKQLGEGKDACPSHGDIQDGRNPFRTVNPKQLQDASQKGDAPYGNQHERTGHAREHQQADRCVTAGNQNKDHHMIDLFADTVGPFRCIESVVASACTVQGDHAQCEDQHGKKGMRLRAFLRFDQQSDAGDKTEDHGDQVSNGTAGIFKITVYVFSFFRFLIRKERRSKRHG